MKRSLVLFLFGLGLATGAFSGIVAASAQPAQEVSAQRAKRDSITPLVAHHQHLLSPTLREAWLPPPETAIELPGELAQVLKERERISGNNDATDVYTEDARENGASPLKTSCPSRPPHTPSRFWRRI